MADMAIRLATMRTPIKRHGQFRRYGDSVAIPITLPEKTRFEIIAGQEIDLRILTDGRRFKLIADWIIDGESPDDKEMTS